MPGMAGIALKPLVFVMGGVRIHDPGGKQRRRRGQRVRTRRRSRLGGSPAMELNAFDQNMVAEPDQWRAARRFVKNSNDRLSRYYVKTPIGHVALRSSVPALRKFRERAMAHAIAAHNTVHRDWQVLVELTWTDLGDDARSTLLTLMAEDLPPAFFEREDDKAVQAAGRRIG
jgi:hypothetical protein